MIVECENRQVKATQNITNYELAIFSLDFKKDSNTPILSIQHMLVTDQIMNNDIFLKDGNPFSSYGREVWILLQEKIRICNYSSNKLKTLANLRKVSVLSHKIHHFLK
eukprot:GHVP01043577.1.p2 GENE.GHVP01043577.1~~GHVP01043577.1.p2  ORF type:complete len:108 (+),score=14.71 GHVP01043577.1:1830-2153(+)